MTAVEKGALGRKEEMMTAVRRKVDMMTAVQRRKRIG
jgi:hypothetical protein